MKVKINDVAMSGEKVIISVQMGNGQKAVLKNYTFDKVTDLNIDKLKEAIRVDLDKYEKIRSRFGELKNLIGKDLEI